MTEQLHALYKYPHNRTYFAVRRHVRMTRVNEVNMLRQCLRRSRGQFCRYVGPERRLPLYAV